MKKQKSYGFSSSSSLVDKWLRRSFFFLSQSCFLDDLFFLASFFDDLVKSNREKIRFIAPLTLLYTNSTGGAIFFFPKPFFGWPFGRSSARGATEAFLANEPLDYYSHHQLTPKYSYIQKRALNDHNYN